MSESALTEKNTETAEGSPYQITELVRSIVKSLVDFPEKVEINIVASGQAQVMELRVAKEDIGKVIGRSGRTAEAIRTILNCGASKFNSRYILRILEE